MASSYRRLIPLARQSSTLFFSTTRSPISHSLLHPPPLQLQLQLQLQPISHIFTPFHNFSSQNKNPNQHHHDNEDDEDDDDEDDDDEVDYSSEEYYDDHEPNFVEDKIHEAVNIGYKVLGPLKPDDRVFKPYEPAFAVVQVGSHQFKVSNGDCIYVEKLKYCEVNDKLILNKVLMAGSSTQTMIGRPILPDVAVHAVVEEHALDAKVIIFKKKRRKNYRRTKGHRQELTRLRITDIQGVEKPETPPVGKTPKTSVKKVETVAMAV